MDLLKKIFPISAAFAKQGNGKFIVGALIYFALTLLCVPLMFMGIGVIVSWYVTLGVLVFILMQCDAINEGDTMTDVWHKVFPLSYKFGTDKDSFVKGLIIHLVALLLTAFSTYALIGIILMIVEYCKNNKAAEETVEEKVEE